MFLQPGSAWLDAVAQEHWTRSVTGLVELLRFKRSLLRWY
jgi:phage terminase small subunit